MAKQRRDSRGRVLRQGEMQMKDGRYRYKYQDAFKKEHVIYSWRLSKSDPLLKSKPLDLSLREKEEAVLKDQMNGLVGNINDYTVLDLVEKYVATRTAVRPTTMAGYQTVLNHLRREPFGHVKIDKVRILDAKLWMIKL